MQWFFDINNIWAVAIYPLVAFALIVFGRTFQLLPKRGAMLLTCGATFLGFLHTVGAIQWLLAQDPHHLEVVEKNWTWLQAGDFKLSLGFLLDAMSVMMLFVVTFISFWIQVYTHGYMEHDDGYCKFYGYLALFNFSMLGLVLSTNLFQIYVFWELVGVSSYLLIGFWFTRPSAAAACLKAFLMNRVGDFGFLLGILGLMFFTYSWWQSNPEHVLLSFTGLPHLVEAIQANPGSFAAIPLTFIAFLIFMGPMAKSAQVPLHTWLPDAMEGPTPISALIHAATMVAAGVYLIGRVYPLFYATDAALAIVVLIGTLTAFVGATIALTQTDIKKALAYSTMSQLGYMVCAMGLGAAGFVAGLFHLFTHAFFKALLFLCSGSVIHACEDNQDMRKMGGLKSKLPITHITYLVGCIAIAGFPFTSGFFSKDMILHAAHGYNSVIYIVLTLVAGLTAFYMFRTYFMTFWGEYRGEGHVHHEHPWMTTPLAVLAFPALGIGFMMASGGVEGLSQVANFPQFADFIAAPVHAEHAHHSALVLGEMLTGAPTILALLGIAVAFFFYATKDGDKWPEKIRTTFPSLNSLFDSKWYFDELYQGFVDKVYLVFAEGSSKFDKGFIDGIVNWTGGTTMGTGSAVKYLQSGRVQLYIAVLLFGITILTLLMFFGLLS